MIKPQEPGQGEMHGILPEGDETTTEPVGPHLNEDELKARLELVEKLATKIETQTSHLEERAYRFFGGITFLGSGAIAFGFRQDFRHPVCR